eukprot:363760-Chlamydomonas_euryale.AAC.10
MAVHDSTWQYMSKRITCAPYVWMYAPFLPPAHAPASRRLWDAWEWHRGDRLHGKVVECSCGACASMRMLTPYHAGFASTFAVFLAAFGYARAMTVLMLHARDHNNAVLVLHLLSAVKVPHGQSSGAIFRFSAWTSLPAGR